LNQRPKILVGPTEIAPAPAKSGRFRRAPAARPLLDPKNHMRHLFPCSFVILIAALMSACSQPVTSPSAIAAPPSAAYIAAQLEGTWTLDSIQPAGGEKQDRPSTAAYTLTFTEGRLSTRVDCNQCAGTFSVTGSTLMAGPNLACTRAACPTVAFESAYTAILNGASDTVVTNSTLTLSSPRGTLQFVRE
jgi:heat shock protein HslJ